LGADAVISWTYGESKWTGPRPRRIRWVAINGVSVFTWLVSLLIGKLYTWILWLKCYKQRLPVIKFAQYNFKIKVFYSAIQSTLAEIPFLFIAQSFLITFH